MDPFETGTQGHGWHVLKVQTSQGFKLLLAVGTGEIHWPTRPHIAFLECFKPPRSSDSPWLLAQLEHWHTRPQMSKVSNPQIVRLFLAAGTVGTLAHKGAHSIP